MKSLILTLFLVISFQSFSQIRRIDNANWLLRNLIINSENHFNPINSSGEPVYSSFQSISGFDQYFDTWFCDSTGINLVYDQSSSSFTISSMGTTLGGCFFSSGVNPDEVNDVHWKFVNFFSNNGAYNGVFNYIIVLENLNTPRTLTITAPNGDIAIYHHSEYLTSKEFSNSLFSIYPNPVKDKLSFLSTNGLSNFKIQITDFSGKLVMTKEKQNSNSINIEKLSQGIYFVSIEDDLGNVSTKKFIKI